MFWIATPPVPYGMHASCLSAVEASIRRAHLTDLSPDRVVAALDAVSRGAR